MANWQYKINIKAIHNSYKETEDLDALKAAMAEECADLSGRVRLAPDVQTLKEIAARFESVTDIDEYDEVLAGLYNWADYNHMCLIVSF